MSKPCVWNGTAYRSMGQAAAAIGITREAMRHRIEKGWRCDADMKDTRLSYPTRRLQRLNDAHIAARNTE